MTEKKIEELLVTEVKKAGGRAYKFVSPGNDGVPDRIVILPDGRLVFVELKSDTGRLSDLQKVQLKRLLALNQDVRVIYGLHEMDGLIQFLMEFDLIEAAQRIMMRYPEATKETAGRVTGE